MGCTYEIKFNTLLYPDPDDMAGILSWLMSTISSIDKQVPNFFFLHIQPQTKRSVYGHIYQNAIQHALYQWKQPSSSSPSTTTSSNSNSLQSILSTDENQLIHEYRRFEWREIPSVQFYCLNTVFLLYRSESTQFLKMNLLNRTSTSIEFTVLAFPAINSIFSYLVTSSTTSSSLPPNNAINEVCQLYLFLSNRQEVNILQSELLKINRIFYKQLYIVKGLTQKVQQVRFQSHLVNVILPLNK